MRDMIESLMKGENSYPRGFLTAQMFWESFYSEHRDDGDLSLRKAVEDSQLPFQWKLEEEADLSAPFAKSLMALTAIGALYRDGIEDTKLAQRVIRAFTTSTTLSLGVKTAAQDVAKMYCLT